MFVKIIKKWINEFVYKRNIGMARNDLFISFDEYNICEQDRWKILDEMDKVINSNRLYIPNYCIDVDKYPLLRYTIQKCISTYIK